MIKQIVFSVCTVNTALGEVVMAGILQGPSLRCAAVIETTATSGRKKKFGCLP